MKKMLLFLLICTSSIIFSQEKKETSKIQIVEASCGQCQFGMKEKGKKVIFGDDKLPGWELGKTWQRYDKKWVLNSAAKTYKDNISPDIESGKLPKEAKDKYFDYVGRNDVPGAKFFVTYDAEAKGTDGTPGLFKSATSNKEGKTGLR